MIKVLQVIYPFAKLSNGDSVHVDRIEGGLRQGCEVVSVGEDRYKVAVNNVDQDCPGGSCPIK